MVRAQQIKVLLVFANPLPGQRLELDREERQIRQAIERCIYRERIKLVSRQAATTADLQRALIEGSYQIVHLAGHGIREGIFLADERHGCHLVPPTGLARLFQGHPALDCVVLNICYSLAQGAALASVPFTIAMDQEISDEAAIEFARGFYDGLGAGMSYEEAYEQGCIALALTRPHEATLPHLLRYGQCVAPMNEEQREESKQEISARRERPYIRPGHYLIGCAFDLSGSMQASIRSEGEKELNRLQSVELAWRELLLEARNSLRESRARSLDSSIDLLAYGFGLRSVPVCDLFSLLKAIREQLPQAEIEDAAAAKKQSWRRQLSGYAETGALLKSLDLGDLLSKGQRVINRLGEHRAIKEMIRARRSTILARAEALGDTTLSLDEALDLIDVPARWRIDLTALKELVFGATPSSELFEELIRRFQAEQQQRSAPPTRTLLLLISDGKFAQQDPLPLAQQLQRMGVTIISCLISPQDLSDPRQLRNAIAPSWGPEAAVMFELASPLPEQSEVWRHLLRHGWTIYPQARLFVQANHTTVLKEFVRVVLSLLEDSQAARAFPKGW
ncbi:MAG: CHAT domain-containing protein [Thermogemmatispora sp.]|uniref:CHAT domain-containing protein n=1 Tax=Thermogemmatispora sp. TaxID=1968838 RepID=UPI002637C69A|nr:CHAT domain-containing protein [Thermogemmatispora sp.]MBX5459036.1 CHAT domain-containing protein [Thermogemmatispora sp.]